MRARSSSSRDPLRDRILIGAVFLIVFGLALFFVVEITVSFLGWLSR
jgi:hypothetical protein